MKPEPFQLDEFLTKLKQTVSVNRRRLSRELEEQPGRYVWIITQLVHVSGKVLFYEDQVEELESELTKRGMEVKGFGISQARSAVKSSPKLKKLKRTLRRWKKAEMALRYAEKAMTQRANMLQTLSANLRKEQEGS